MLITILLVKLIRLLSLRSEKLINKSLLLVLLALYSGSSKKFFTKLNKPDLMDEFSSKLLKILQDVHDSQKFAEAKNAILLTFSGAGITSCIDLLTENGSEISDPLKFGLSLTIILLSMSSVVCSLSFIPRINVERILWLRNKSLKKSNFLTRKHADNFYYFGYLQKYTYSQLLDALNDCYFDGKLNRNYKKEYQDIAEQIVINSEITFRKFKIFTYAIYFLILSILVLPIPVIINLALELIF